MKKYWCAIILFLFIGCQNSHQPNKVDIIEKELRQLHSIVDKKNYLESLFDDDQKYRRGQITKLIFKYGKESETVKNFIEMANIQDAENLEKAERYLSIHGHPKINEVGEIATQTIWGIIHHSNTYEEKARNFHFLHAAFLEGDIDEDAYSMYLERMYEVKYQQKLDMGNRYFPRTKIDTLIGLLHLGK